MIFNLIMPGPKAADPPVPTVPPNPDKVRQIVQGYEANKGANTDGASNVAAILTYLGEPFACYSLFESFDELGITDEEKKQEYKKLFLEILQICEIELEWDSDYHIKRISEDTIVANAQGEQINLWRNNLDLTRTYQYMVSQLRSYSLSDVFIDQIRAVAEYIVSLFYELDLMG